MSAQPHNPEYHQPEVSFMSPEGVADLAARAYLAPESLNGAEQITLKGDGITWDPNKLKPLGDNGPLVVLELGDKRTLKLYGIKQEGKWQFAITPGRYVNDDVDDHAHVQNIVFVDDRMMFGRDVPGTSGSLGLTKDVTVSRNHFVVEPSNDQLRVQDISTNGTKVTFVEEKHPGLGDAFHDIYRARLFGGIVLPKND